MNLSPDPALLIKALEEGRVKTETTLQNLDSQAVVYPATEETEAWTVKDIIGHITAWEEEGVRSLQAFLERKTYVIAEPLDAYNARQVARRKGFTYERILTDWREIRQMMMDTIAPLSPEKLREAFTFAWNERGDTPTFVKGMIWHEAEHRADIIRAVGG